MIIHVIFFRKYETKICDDEGFRKEIERDSYTIWGKFILNYNKYYAVFGPVPSLKSKLMYTQRLIMTILYLCFKAIFWTNWNKSLHCTVSKIQLHETSKRNYNSKLSFDGSQLSHYWCIQIMFGVFPSKYWFEYPDTLAPFNDLGLAWKCIYSWHMGISISQSV